MDYFVGGGLGFSWADKFSASKSYNVNLYGGVTYKFNDEFSLSGGAGAYLNACENYLYRYLESIKIYKIDLLPNSCFNAAG